MCGRPAGGEFFTDPMYASLAKIEILGNYLTPFACKLGSRPPGRVWLVDGFAGAGSYDRDESGHAEDGSPLASARVARDLELKNARQQLRMINVEVDLDTYLKLIGNLAPHKHLCANINDTFENALEEILAMIGNDPALFFLDPFGVSGIEMRLLDRIRESAGKTELLIHFSDRSVLRMAGNLDDNEQRKEVGQKAADATVQKLDEMIGSPWWQRIWLNKEQTTEERIDEIAKQYASELRTRGFDYAHEIRMRDGYTDRPKPTRLLHALAAWSRAHELLRVRVRARPLRSALRGLVRHLLDRAEARGRGRGAPRRDPRARHLQGQR